MLPQRLYEHLCELLSLQFGQKINAFFVNSIGGGSINQTYQLTGPDGQQLFCKINSADRLPFLFLKEQRGLQLLQQTGAIAVPKIVGYTVFENNQVLLLQWIESGPKDKSFFKLFGQRLAQLHGHTQPLFGLDEDNYMGSIPQHNTPHQSWPAFFTGQRLQPLVRQCLDKNLLTKHEVAQFESLYKKLPGIFDEAQAPALLHGDLWSGNYMCNSSGQPVLIDPAVYYGHPAVDLGMTTLFGPFDKAFYESYHYHRPLPANSTEQWQVCNLYPLLIHLLLFGSSYVTGIRQTLKAFA